MIKANYHTHTYRCKHAEGDIEEYVKAAAAGGIQTLGFSEHMPLPNDRWVHAHLEASQLDEYVSAVRSCSERYRSELTVLTGGECEYVKEDHAWYEDVLLGEYQLDYLLGAPHWIPTEGTWKGYTYLDDVRGLIDFASYCMDAISSGLFSYFAHPDVFMVGYKTWDENARACALDIMDAALEYRLPIELNTYGLRKSKIRSFEEFEHSLYPDADFWRLAEEKQVPMIIGSDAHRPDHLCDSIEINEQVVKEYGLVYVHDLQLIDRK